ncbi:MAG TPA: glycosyltransferase, partial [Candidatus Omnitrophota bacterium]|nr:glycosyltransferase [Candidatus Omnitrophota bacterium]
MKKLLIVVQRFPVLSETFIEDHVLGFAQRSSFDVSLLILEGALPPEDVPDPLKSLARVFRVTRPKTEFKKTAALLKIIFRFFHKWPLLLKAVSIPGPGAWERLFILEHVLSGGYDLMHCHFGTAANTVLFLKDLFPSMKLVVSFLGYDIHKYPHEHGAGVYAGLFLRMDRAVVNTRFSKDKLIALGCPPEKVSLIPLGFDLAQTPFKVRPAPSGGRIKFVCVGRLVEKKGHSDLLKAFDQVLDQYPFAELHLVGDGPLAKDLESEARQLGVLDAVFFYGALSRKKAHRICDECHIFVIACRTAADQNMEGQCLVLQEAQAM